MMTGANPTEPSFMRGAEREGAIDETSLRKLMRDPRYWRDGDRKTVDRVSKGFSTLYG